MRRCQWVGKRNEGGSVPVRQGVPGCGSQTGPAGCCRSPRRHCPDPEQAIPPVVEDEARLRTARFHISKGASQTSVSSAGAMSSRRSTPHPAPRYRDPRGNATSSPRKTLRPPGAAAAGGFPLCGRQPGERPAQQRSFCRNIWRSICLIPTRCFCTDRWELPWSRPVFSSPHPGSPQTPSRTGSPGKIGLALQLKTR